MTADEYLNGHWIKKRIYTHNENPKHRVRLVAMAERLVGGRFLDVGCACGHSTHALALLHPGEWAGIDFGHTAVEMARRDFPQYKFFYSKDYNYAAMTGQYDSIVCSEVLEHVPDDRRFVDEMLGVAKYRIAFSTPNRPVNDPGHLRVYTEDTLRALFPGLPVNIVRDGIFFFGYAELS